MSQEINSKREWTKKARLHGAMTLPSSLYDKLDMSKETVIRLTEGGCARVYQADKGIFEEEFNKLDRDEEVMTIPSEDIFFEILFGEVDIVAKMFEDLPKVTVLSPQLTRGVLFADKDLRDVGKSKYLREEIRDDTVELPISDIPEGDFGIFEVDFSNADEVRIALKDNMIGFTPLRKIKVSRRK